MGVDTIRTITDEAALNEIIGSPAQLIVAKVADRLNELTRQFIERTPFVCVATASPGGGLDVSPRGDPAQQDLDADEYDREREQRYARRQGFY